MTQFSVSISTFKYGQLREERKEVFESQNHFNEYVSELQEYKDYLLSQEDPYIKWVERFYHNGIDYSFPIDC